MQPGNFDNIKAKEPALLASDKTQREANAASSSTANNEYERNHSDSSDETESSEAETVILGDDNRQKPKQFKRLQRRIEVSSSEDEEERLGSDNQGIIVLKRKDRAELNKQINESSDKLKPIPNNKRVTIVKHGSRSESPDLANGPPAQAIRNRDASGRLLLQKLCDKGDYARAKELLKAGVDVNDRDYAGNTAIHDAALKGHNMIVSLLIEYGAIIDIRSGVADLDTPLIDAASRGHIDVVNLLLDKGADPRIFNAQGKTALDSIPEDSPNFKQLEIMLKEAAFRIRQAKRRNSNHNYNEQANDSGEDVDKVDKSLSYDPSHSIPGTFPPELSHNDNHSNGSRRGRHDNNYESSSPADSYSRTTSRRRGARGQAIRNDLLWMDLTTRTGREQVYLKAADGDIEYVGKSLEEGWQPDGDCLVLAAKHGHTDLVGLLLAFGGQSDALNEDGVTALHETIGRGHLDTVKLLLDSGADPLRLDERGRSYLDIAREAVGSDDEEVVLITDAMDKARKILGGESTRSNEAVDKAKAGGKDADAAATGTLKKRKLAIESNVPLFRHEEESLDEDPSAMKKLKSKHNDEPKADNSYDQDEEFEIQKKEREFAAVAAAAEKKNMERIAAEKAIAERLAAEKAISEKMAAEKAIADRLAAEKAAIEKVAAEKAAVAAAEERLALEKVKEEELRKKREKMKEVTRQRELLEAQKEKERKEREKQMLKNLELEEKRKEDKRKREKAVEVERQKREQVEQEIQQKFQQEQEIERQKALQQKQEAELRRHFPYGIRTAKFDGNRTKQEMATYLPLLLRTFSSGISSGELGYFLDIQIGLFLGLGNIYQNYPDLSKKLVTEQEKSRIWSMIVPWMCRPLVPEYISKTNDQDMLWEMAQDREKFMAMSFFWLKVEQVVELFKRDFVSAYEIYSTVKGSVITINLDYDEAQLRQEIEGAESQPTPPSQVMCIATSIDKIPVKFRVKLKQKIKGQSQQQWQ